MKKHDNLKDILSQNLGQLEGKARESDWTTILKRLDTEEPQKPKPAPRNGNRWGLPLLGLLIAAVGLGQYASRQKAGMYSPVAPSMETRTLPEAVPASFTGATAAPVQEPAAGEKTSVNAPEAAPASGRQNARRTLPRKAAANAETSNPSFENARPPIPYRGDNGTVSQGGHLFQGNTGGSHSSQPSQKENNTTNQQNDF